MRRAASALIIFAQRRDDEQYSEGRDIIGELIVGRVRGEGEDVREVVLVVGGEFGETTVRCGWEVIY